MHKNVLISGNGSALTSAAWALGLLAAVALAAPLAHAGDSGSTDAIGARIVSGTFPHVNESAYVYWPNGPDAPLIYYNGIGDLFTNTWAADDALYVTVGDGYGTEGGHPQFAVMDEGINYQILDRDRIDTLTTATSLTGRSYPLRVAPNMNFSGFTGEPGTEAGMTGDHGFSVWKVHADLPSPLRPALGRLIIGCGMLSVRGSMFIAYYNSSPTPTNSLGHGFAFVDTAGIMKWNGKRMDEAQMQLLARDSQAYKPLTAENIVNFNQFTGYRFITPEFIQFGRDYADYPLFENQNPPYVYAISPHINWHNRNALYLGRAKLSEASGAWDQWGKWEYYVGLDSTGVPMWHSDVQRAKSILYTPNQCGMNSVIYEKNTGQFLLATYDNHGDFVMLNTNDKRFSLWAAKAPWGPWRRIMNNDYNAVQYRPAQELRRQGGSGYACFLMPKFVTQVDGHVRLWLLTPCFSNPPYQPFDDLLDTSWESWDTHWPQSYYTLNFSQVELATASDGGPNAASDASAVVQLQPGNSPWGKPDEQWVGCRLHTGPDPLTVTQLGRYYVSGNQNSHPVVLLTGNSASATLVAKAEVDLSGANQADALAFKYAAPAGGPVTLDANTDYYLLSREGLSSTDPIRPAHVATDMSAVKSARTDFGGLAGFQFKTGPLGLRVTHVGRYDLAQAGGAGARDWVIDEVTANPSETEFTTSRILTTQIGPSDPVDSEGYRVHELGYPGVDLKPLTRYFVGTRLQAGDTYYGGSLSGPGAPRLTFDPNVLQFINAATMATAASKWTIADSSMAAPGAVFGPISFKCQIPDRVFGDAPENASGQPIDAMPRLNVNRNLGLQVLSAGAYRTDSTWGWGPIDDRNAALGPIDALVDQDGAVSALAQSYASTGWQANPIRGSNSFNGYAGIRVRVGPKNVTVRGLGRYVSGETLLHAHDLVVMNVADNSIVGKATLNAGSVTGRKSTLGFVYGLFTTPVTLQAGLDYVFGSREYLESADPTHYDPFFGLPSDLPVIDVGSAFTPVRPAKASAGSGGLPGTIKEYYGAASTSFGPVNLRYQPLNRTLAGQPVVHQVNADWTGFHGYRFQTGDRPLAVKALGRWCLPGNSAKHEIRIQKVEVQAVDATANPSEVVASALVDASGTAQAGYRYASLATPVQLEANTEYYIGSYETLTGDRFAADVTLTPPSDLIQIEAGAFTRENEEGRGGAWYTVHGDVAGRVLNALDIQIQ